jgi:hypothetical protein
MSRTVHRGSPVPALVAISVCAHSAIWAGARNGGGGVVTSAVATVAVSGDHDHEEIVEPWIHPKMAPEVRAKLEAGFELAVERVREINACGDLFTQLGEDGIDILKTGLYLQVHSYRHEVMVCGRDLATNSQGADILAYTKVGGTPTWICRNFARVSDETAAMTVLHEALHHAGLEERPHDRMAMSSVEITEMVQSACAF